MGFLWPKKNRRHTLTGVSKLSFFQQKSCLSLCGKRFLLKLLGVDLQNYQKLITFTTRPRGSYQILHNESCTFEMSGKKLIVTSTRAGLTHTDAVGFLDWRVVELHLKGSAGRSFEASYGQLRGRHENGTYQYRSRGKWNICKAN